MALAMNKLSSWGWRMGVILMVCHALGAGAEEMERDVKARPPHEWGYSGTRGPDHWGEMGFPLCIQGRKQSPVDFAVNRKSIQLDLEMDYRSSLLRVLNTGRAIKVIYEPGSTVKYGDRRYELTQFQFHTPSEHTLGGRTYPMEIQFLHRAVDGKLLQLAVFATEGEQAVNGTVDALFSALPMKVDMELIGNFYLNAADLLPRELTAFFYVGSLTTPPCTEGVAWFVYKEPLHLPAGLISRMASLLGRNTRPIQKILIDKPPETKGKKGETSKKSPAGVR
ncbi:MAG: hypothetical protein G8345_06470 [Magnetococcales bacterium]|nr:carbonic anhydrase family protein [Magnetococcales bacterium]NGZ26515.1 hypothetical protein [Magnetococcales bacterium]